MKKNDGQSGIVEVISDLDRLLDELIHERTEHEHEEEKEMDDMDAR